MKKKAFLIIGVTVILAVIVFLIVYILNNKADKQSEAICAIPPESALIIEINYPLDFINSTKEEIGIFYDLSGILDFSCNNSLLHYIDTLDACKYIESSDVNQNIIWSFHPDGGGKFNQLLVVNIPEEVKQEKVADEFKVKLEESGKISNRDFQGVKLYEFKSTGQMPGLHFYVKNGLLVVSTSQKLVEESVESLMSTKSVKDISKEFADIYSTAGKKEIANIYVNMSLFPDTFLKYLSDQANESFALLKSFSYWAELDLSFDEQKLSLNGFSGMADSIPVYSKVLNSQISTNLKCAQVLPDNTSYYFAMAFNNTEAFRQSLAEYNEHIGQKQLNIEKYSEIKESTGLDINTTFYSLIDNEVCYAVTTPGAHDKYENSYMIFGLKSQASAEMELDNIIQGIKLNTGISESELKDKIRIDENTSLDVYILPFEGLPELLFGHYFNKCSGKYVCCVNNFMIFANSKNSLFKIVYDVVLHKTLETSIDYNLFLENFSESSNLFIYFSMFNGMDIFKNLFNEQTRSAISSNEDVFYSFGNFGYQINQSNEMLYNNLVIKQQKYTIEKPQTIWESRLDTTVAAKPALVINHDNSSKEILVQDYNNNLYLLSNSGREIWSIQLDERIESDVYQIDLYKNGKLQYLFSSKNQIHLIDRLGNYVDKYPVKLRASATAPISLFDYSNNKNYRIVVPCENNEVYLYDGEGDLVKGWEFGTAENIVTSSINHYGVDGEDYIVFHDKYKAYFVNRKGESKLEFLTKFSFSEKNPIYFDYTYSKDRFVTTDENGTVRFFYSNEKQDSLDLGEFSKDHYFVLKDVDSDGSADYVFLDNNRLEVYNKQKKLMMAYDFEAEPTSEPVFYSFPRNQIKIGVVCSSVSKIYLINSDGSLFDGFPLYGLTPFSIGYLNSESNKFNLIVGGQENLLYNYEVNEN